MWARLSRPFSIRNRPGHVSCFRIRAGQLSQDLNAYYAEIEAQRPRLKAALGLPGLIFQNLRHYTNRAINLADRYLARRPLFFPLKTSGAGLGYQAPDGRAPASAVTGNGSSAPRCPLSKRHPDTFLFSSRDTRFGDDLINHVYHCSETDVAVVHPPLSREELNGLYEKYYSNPHTQIIPTPQGRYSPYQKYRGGSWLMKLLYRISLPIYITRTIHWTDRTYEQLLEAVSDTFAAKGQKLRFLDVGCFEGSLLDRVAKETDWQTFGLEPNAHAVAKCLAKGHKVWEGYADDASYVVPAGETFDLIYLGQTIEHLADPLTVTRRLRDLLRPGGLLVMSTPNLRAMQIELFGPTWAHWHVPYHRNLFSESALRKMAEMSGLEVMASRHYCHPYWTCLSVAQNDLGIGAVVSHAVDFSTVNPTVVSRALSLTYWNNLLYNWRGKGDFMFMVMKKPM
jgi:2-polyprenyl-3-methyl-5-hydroxy-6-metoxy-1,4-benzoquinol methylase